jgi:hypothetical protein
LSTTIKDRRVKVQILLSNRSDLAAIQGSETHSKIDGWLSDAYIDLGNSYGFEDLELGPITMITPNDGVTAYMPLPDECRAVKQISIDPNGDGHYIPMYGPSDYNVLRRTSSVAPGMPSRWARRGYNVWFDRAPDKTYNIQVTYWQKPLIIVDATNSASDIEDTLILMPDDWLEILDRCAALRGWEYIQDPLGVQGTKTMLYGDPSDPRKGPGLIKAKMMARTAERTDSNYAIAPYIIPYTRIR